jgi:hypothetical protein
VPPSSSNTNTNASSAQSSASRTSRNSEVTPPPRGDILPTSADEEFEDGRVRNAEAVTKIRDAWIYTQISARAKEFTQYRNVSSRKCKMQKYSEKICFVSVYCRSVPKSHFLYLLQSNFSVPIKSNVIKQIC